MVAARQTYMVPFIRAFSGENRNNNRIAWRRVDGKPMEMDDWNRLSSVALHIGIGSDGPEMLYLINQTNAPARFVLPKDRQQDWRLICDTNMRHAQHGHAEGEVLQLPVSMSILHYQPKKNRLKSSEESSKLRQWQPLERHRLVPFTPTEATFSLLSRYRAIENRGN